MAPPRRPCGRWTNSLRLELAAEGTLVVGAHLGYTDTDMYKDLDVPKNDPRDVARQIVAAVEKNEPEVLADPPSQYFKSALAGPVEGLAVRRPGRRPAGERHRSGAPAL